MAIFDKPTTRLGRTVAKVYREQEAEVEAFAKEHNTTCRKGCSTCCYSLVLMTVPEAVVIADHILQSRDWMNEEKLEGLLARLYRQIKVFSDPAARKEEECDKGIPCPFLDLRAGTCMVYEQRPSACRYNHAVSDPEKCKGENYDKLNMSKFESAVLEAARTVCKKVGVPLGLSPLAVAMTWAMKSLSEGAHILHGAMDPDLGVMGLEYWRRLLEKGQSEEDDR